MCCSWDKRQMRSLSLDSATIYPSGQNEGTIAGNVGYLIFATTFQHLLAGK